jgi:hypothetical protein
MRDVLVEVYLVDLYFINKEFEEVGVPSRRRSFRSSQKSGAQRANEESATTTLTYKDGTTARSSIIFPMLVIFTHLPSLSITYCYTTPANSVPVT